MYIYSIIYYSNDLSIVILKIDKNVKFKQSNTTYHTHRERERNIEQLVERCLVLAHPRLGNVNYWVLHLL